MRRQHIYPLLSIGVFVAAALVASWGAAQYGSGEYGDVPTVQGGPGGVNQPVVPLPPVRPPVNSRPPSWPGVPTDQSPQTPPAGALPPGQMTTCNGSRIVAIVGSEVILDSDLILRKVDKRGTFEIIGSVDRILEEYKNQYPPDQLNAQREALIGKLLPEVVQIKLIYLDAKQTIPSEHWSDVEKQLTKGYEEIQLERTMKQFGVTSPSELDPKLRALGTSLEREKRAFVEFVLARQWEGQQIKRDEEITLDQMLTYFHRHQDEFTTPARARWEELTASFSKYPTEDAAWQAIVQMGNQAFAGAPIAQVAGAGSRHNWTNKGSMVPELDQALFNQPIGQLSPNIIRSPIGFHIIRVTEREEAAVALFRDAQIAIRDKILKERSTKQLHAYFAKLQARTPVKTIFDDPQLAQRPGQSQFK